MKDFCKLPKDIPSSQYINEKTLIWYSIQLYGTYYYIPITVECKKLLKLKKIKGKLEFPTLKSEHLFADYM